MTRSDRRISNLALLVCGAASVLASLYVLRNILVPVLMAGFLAVLFQPIKLFLARHFGKRPHLFALLLTFGVLVLVVIPVALLIFLLLDQVTHALTLARGWIGEAGVLQLSKGSLPPKLADLLGHVQQVVPMSADDLRNELQSATRLIGPTVAGILSFSGKSLFSLLILFMSLFYFFLDGERLVAWLTAILPLQERHSRELFTEFGNVSYAMVFGSAFAMLLTAIIASLGFWPIGVPQPIVWGTLTGLCEIAPAVGSALIWVPLAVVLALTGKLWVGIRLTAFCLIVLGIGVDNLLRPLIVGRNLAMHPLLIFLGILGGVTTFGLAGLVIGPMVLALAMAVLRIYLRDFVSVSPETAAAIEAPLATATLAERVAAATSFPLPSALSGSEPPAILPHTGAGGGEPD